MTQLGHAYKKDAWWTVEATPMHPDLLIKNLGREFETQLTMFQAGNAPISVDQRIKLISNSRANCTKKQIKQQEDDLVAELLQGSPKKVMG